MTTDAGVIRRPGPHDDPGFDEGPRPAGRGYEHRAQELAVRRLLRGRRFEHAVDAGGGCGRLCPVLAEHAVRVTLAGAGRQLADAVRPRLPDSCADLAALIRVLHHLPDPGAELAELARLLRPGGLAVVETANSVRAGNRLAALIRGHRVPGTPVDLSPEAARLRGTAPFVHHHPRTLARQFRAAGLSVRRVLSVSNLRYPAARAVLPERVMLAAEQVMQVPLGRCHLGPSMFFLLEKEPPRWPGSGRAASG